MAKTFAALIIALCLACPVLAAESTGTRKPAVIKPSWAELAPAQQTILAPLAKEWDSMDSARRRNWLRIAERYPKMKPTEQQRLQKRMRDWAQLTPAQRQAARENYLRLRKLSAEQRKQIQESWELYQNETVSAPESESRQGAAHDNPAPALESTPPPASK